MNLAEQINSPLLCNSSIEKIQQLSKKFKKLKKNIIPAQRKLNISFNAGFTLDYLLEVMPLFFRNRGIEANIFKANYGTINFDINNLKSDYWSKKCDVHVLLPTHRNLVYAPNFQSNRFQLSKILSKESKPWFNLWKAIKKPIVQLTFDPPTERHLGDSDGLNIGGAHHYVRQLNSFLIENAPSHVNFLDSEQIASAVGMNSWHDQRMYYLTKQPFSMEVIPYIANKVSSTISSIVGLSKKVLVLDLDNTIWGGLAGEEGAAGIVLGNETPEGEAFVNFQKYLKGLSSKGVILCVCSKNEEKMAKTIFKNHSSMILKLEDVAVFLANFKDKATNIREISKKLNLGLDSFVFIDDSSTECALIKSELPEVWTIQMDGDPSFFSRKIDQVNPFSFRHVTKEDQLRSESYKKIAVLNSNLNSKTNIDKFLKNLETKAIIESVRSETVERISQLIAKTNQFKLNPNLFSVSELKKLKKNTLAIRLKDRTQDFGIVSAVVFNIDRKNKLLKINNWVMSCRVFSRRLEFFILDLIIKVAKKNKCKNLMFDYQKTKKNILFFNFLTDLVGKNINKNNLFKLSIKNIKFNKKNYILQIKNKK